MNKIYYLYITLMFCNESYLGSAVGCMDNSYHMTKPCDRKELRYKRCNCPCRKIVNQKGLCLDCGHIGNPSRGEINSRQTLETILR